METWPRRGSANPIFMAAKWVALCCLPAYDAAFTVINRQKSAHPAAVENRVVVLVDCDNTKPEILEHALRVVAQFGRVVLHRGYGNHATLANRCQEALVCLAVEFQKIVHARSRLMGG